MNLREALVMLIEFAREHGPHLDKLQRAAKRVEDKAESLRKKHEARYAVVVIDAEAPTELTRQQILIDFRGAKCRACGGKKLPRCSSCFTCWDRLKPTTQKALRCNFGDGFEQAYELSLLELKGCIPALIIGDQPPEETL